MDTPQHYERRLHPNHRTTPLRSSGRTLQRCYDAGDIELDTYSAKYCVACEEYFTDEELLEDGLAQSISVQSTISKKRITFPLGQHQDRLLKWYDEHPGVIKPDFAVTGARSYPWRLA